MLNPKIIFLALAIYAAYRKRSGATESGEFWSDPKAGESSEVDVEEDLDGDLDDDFDVDVMIPNYIVDGQGRCFDGRAGKFVKSEFCIAAGDNVVRASEG